jgi:hypothetical protein
MNYRAIMSGFVRQTAIIKLFSNQIEGRDVTSCGVAFLCRISASARVAEGSARALGAWL